MSHTHHAPTPARRDLTGSLRKSRPRKRARLRHRLLQAERLEDRQLLATISGQAFNDLNANGLKDTDESGQSGWTIYLDADGNGQLGTGEISATTAADGSYSFVDLAAGSYNVAEVQQPGWQQSLPVGSVPSIERVTVADDGTQGNADPTGMSISADGRYVAFTADASNLVPNDTNGKWDVFVYDRQTNMIERVSVASDGTQANDFSGTCSISADGRYVAFQSGASNLVPGDTNGASDDFVYDRQTDTIERVSVASDGTQGNGASNTCSISADGRYVAFQSLATNLVPGDTNGFYDAFVYDRQTEAIERVSLAADGTQGNNSLNGLAISSDGRYVVFNSYAGNLVPGDTNGVGDVFVTANPFAPVPGSHVVAFADGQVVSGLIFGNTSLPTKFYVVNDASLDRTYEYNGTGTSVETYGLNSGNSAPRGAGGTVAGDKTWVVDANRKVYVYDTSGGLLGSWTAGTLATNATVEGITTNGTDVWIVDAKSDKVYKYTGAASRLSGSQNAASSFSLNSANTSPKDIVTDGVNLWVVNDSSTDKVFKYTTAGSLLSSWTISTAGATSPTGITLDPANVSYVAANIWIVDSGTDRVYQYNFAATFANGSSHAANVSFALATANTNPQGIADPPAPGSLLVTETPTQSVSHSSDTALASLYYEPVKNAPAALPVPDSSLRMHTALRSDSVERVAAALAEPAAHRTTDDSRGTRDNRRQAAVDDLFAQWESDPLELLSLPDLGV